MYVIGSPAATGPLAGFDAVVIASPGAAAATEIPAVGEAKVSVAAVPFATAVAVATSVTGTPLSMSAWVTVYPAPACVQVIDAPISSGPGGQVMVFALVSVRAMLSIWTLPLFVTR